MGLENITRTFAFLVIVSGVTLCMHMPDTTAQECVHPGGNVPFILHGDYNLSGNKNVADVQCAILVALWSLGGQQVAPPTCVVVPIALADIDCDSVYTVSDVLLATKLALSEPLDEVLDGDGDGCPDTCTACVPPEETSCFIAGVCYPEETTKADNSCLTCDSDNAALSWTTFADGTPCEENSGKLCASGLCAAVLPGAPTNVIATALDKAASVAFDPPTNNGGSSLLFFTVTSTPEGKTAIGAQSPITITGLTNGTGYTFTVKATTAVGTGPNSESSNLVTPTAACSEGLANCDDVEENGCEINVLTSMQHCGACNSPCDLANGSEVCAAGSCVLTTCDPGFGNCDQNPLNGCETEVLYSQQHCGACDTPCSPANGTGICVDGTCQLVDCLDNFADCDQNPQTGCEANLIASLDHCSACNSPCLLLNAVNACAMSTCQIATCVLGFDNCDMIKLTGCETNIASSLSNCGGCNIPCEPEHATGVCNQGSCLILECVAAYGNCDGDPGTGCETFTATSLEHCGSCNSPCSLQNATPKCTAGNCLIDKCMAGFGNCDNSDSTGCETSTLNSLAHCGGCNLPCQYANATATCAGGICQFGTCQTNFHNLDELTNNGCEYACTFSSTTDLPDDTFKDANCDGIDGDPTKAVFVAKTGSAANPGTKSLPMATITQGIAKAVSLGRTQVYVSEGVYSERVTLISGVSLYGAYSAINGWARSASYVTEIQTGQVLGGRRSAMEGVNITAATTVDRLKIRTLASTGAGISSYGVYCQNCNALTLKNNVIEAAPGNEGSQGTVGGVGTGGTNGIGGGSGSCDTNTSGGAGGSAGSSNCGRSGGNGGKGGDHGDNDGASGGPGTGGTPGGSGGSGGDPGKAGGVGQGGANGTQGAHGGGGSGGSTATGFWVGTVGGPGLVGAHGNGGGGGGGGGGQGCFFCNNGPGNGGGGGGGGGCAGNGGSGGTAGGGSFGVFLVTSNGVVLSNNSITSSTGGNGGSGGNGGNGGTGGTGGAGGTVCTGEVGAGGNGGKGGNGGNGGAGGGGAGGPSYAVFKVSTTVSTTSNTLVKGTGGAGGTSSGNAGTVGASGTTN